MVPFAEFSIGAISTFPVGRVVMRFPRAMSF